LEIEPIFLLSLPFFHTRSKWTLFPSERLFLVDVISVDVFSNCGRLFRGPFFRTPPSEREPCKNGWSHWDAVCVDDSWAQNNTCCL